MNMYLNPKKSEFKEILTSKIYVDKTELLAYTNSVLCTSQKYICVSCPDGFGKSITAGMLTSYYRKGENSDYLFNNLKISKNPLYKQHLNHYNVIALNIRDFLGENTIKVLIEQAVIEDLIKNSDIL